MLSYVLFHGGMNPTAVVGGKVLNFNTNARVGEGDYIVFEADESDGSFLKLLPCIGIVSNIDADHLDHYKYFQGLKDAFLILHQQHPLLRLLGPLHRRHHRAGAPPESRAALLHLRPVGGRRFPGRRHSAWRTA